MQSNTFSGSSSTNQPPTAAQSALITAHSFSTQFISCSAGDGRLLFWDLRQRNEPKASSSPIAATASVDVAHVADELPWLPLLVLPLSRPGSGSAGLNSDAALIPVTRFSLMANTTITAVTDDGELFSFDWAQAAHANVQYQAALQALSQGSGVEVPTDLRHNSFTELLPCHSPSAVCVQRCPHFDDCLLTAGDWRFMIWQNGVPVFKSSYAADLITAACWSSSRPAVVITARLDGFIDVYVLGFLFLCLLFLIPITHSWDLLDQAHKPVLSFPTGFSEAIISLSFWQPQGIFPLVLFVTSLSLSQTQRRTVCNILQLETPQASATFCRCRELFAAACSTRMSKCDSFMPVNSSAQGQVNSD